MAKRNREFDSKGPIFNPDPLLMSEVIRRCLTSSITCLALLALLLITNGFEIFQHSVLSRFAAGTVAILCVLRFTKSWLTIRAKEADSYVTPFLTYFIGCNVTTGAAALSALTIEIFKVYGLTHPDTILAVVILAGFSAGGTSAYIGNLWMTRTFLVAALAYPALVFSTLPDGRAISIAIVIYGLFLEHHARYYNQKLKELFCQRDFSDHQHKLLRHVMDSMPANVSLIDSQLNYVVLNEPLLNLIGLDERKLIGHPVGVLGAPKSEFTQLVLAFAQQSQVDTHQQRLVLPTPQGPRWHLLQMRRLRSNGSIVCISIDIHNEIQLEAKNHATQAQLIHSSKMASLGEMAGGIAHEINNPLSIVLGRIDLMINQLEDTTQPHDPAKVRSDLERIRKTASRITKIIYGLRTFARKGDEDPFVDTTLSQVIDETLELCRERLRQNQIDFRLTFKHDGKVKCRATQLSQVILNLLNNASDAIERCESRWIALEVQGTETEWLISVTDSGPGIPKEVADHLMQPFFTTKEVGKGTGLGLSISQGLIKDHGGSLEYVAGYKNTRFEIRLPRVDRVVNQNRAA